MADTYVDRVEQVVDEVADWAMAQIDAVTNALAPNERPFGMDKLSTEEQIAQYLQLRGDSNAWAQFIQAKATEVIESLGASGISQEDIASVHPYEIVGSFLLKHSAEMEALIAKKPAPSTLSEVADATTKP